MGSLSENPKNKKKLVRRQELLKVEKINNEKLKKIKELSGLLANQDKHDLIRN